MASDGPASPRPPRWHLLRGLRTALGAWARERWIPLTLLLLCAAVIAPVSSRPGWPLGHDVFPLFERVEAFRRELGAGNLFPLWTPFCFNGHGSPMPLLYHRLFNTFAGLLALVLGTPAAIKVALIPVLALGSLGMAAAADELECSPWVRLWCGAMLPLAHYTFVNWLVRASAAELTAGMLLPWLIVACLRMQSGKTFGVRLGTVMVLLFYAHVAIFLYTVFLVAVAVIACLPRPRPDDALRRSLGYLARGLGVALGIVMIAAGPYAAAIALVGREFNLDRLAIYLPEHQLRPVWRYFVDDFDWGHTWEGLGVEIGRFLIVALGVAGAIALGKRARPRARTFAFLAGGTLVYFCFQLPLAIGFYTSVPLAHILQFPWRLLVFVTPLVILMLAVLAQAILGLSGNWPRAAVAILAGTWAAQASFATTVYRVGYQWIQPQDLRAELANLDGPPAAGEFLPKDLADRPLPPRAPLFQLDGCTLVSSSADLARLDRVPFETVELTLTSPAGCRVGFSQWRTSLIAVEPSAGGRVLRAPDQTTVVILPAGSSSVRVARRGVLRSLVQALRNPVE